MKKYLSLYAAVSGTAKELFTKGCKEESNTWQGIERKEPMWELLDCSFQTKMTPYIEEAVRQIQPNLPWADVHFEERVGGQPINPGESYKIWPFYKNPTNDKFRKDEIFDHTYMERFWPKEAIYLQHTRSYIGPLRGIRFNYGDLNDVVDQLVRDPHTRQAYLPVFFPEDTGNKHNGRVPCTLGYLFTIRNCEVHITYYIRACDYFRHFRDDVYLAYRLAYWVKEKVNSFLPNTNLSMGNLTMHIANLHVFFKERKILGDGL